MGPRSDCLHEASREKCYPRGKGSRVRSARVCKKVIQSPHSLFDEALTFDIVLCLFVH